MSKKQDKAILEGFAVGGGINARWVPGRKGYRKAIMVIEGLGECAIYGIPTSSPRDPASMKAKARDNARRFVKYNTTRMSW